MRGKYLVFGIFVLMLIGFASAATTTAHIKTLPHHTVFVTPIATGGGGFVPLASPMQGFSGKYGDITFEFEIEESFFDLNVLVKDGQLIVYSEKILGNYESGGELDEIVLALPEGVEPLYPNDTVVEKTEEVIEENITVEENATVEKTAKKERAAISNFYTFMDENEGIFSFVYYAILVLVILTILFLLYRKTKHFNQLKKQIEEGTILKRKKKKGFFTKIGIKKEDDFDIGELEEAEEELKKAKDKVDRLMRKKKESVIRAKKRLADAERQLDDIRNGRSRKEKNSSQDEDKDEEKSKE